MEELELGMKQEEDEAINADFPWVLFKIDKSIYGINSAYILSMGNLDNVTELIDSPPQVRGMCNFRGSMIALNDLRAIFGLPTMAQAMANLLEPKIQAHETWVTTLRACVEEQTAFGLAVDPRACAFGQWFYSFKTDSVTLSSQLKKVEEPHARLHLTGEKIKRCIENGEAEESLRLFNEVILPTFDETMMLLGGLQDAYKAGEREMMIVCEVQGTQKGLVVDDIVSVEYIRDIQDFTDSSGGIGYIKKIAKRDKTNDHVLLLDEENIMMF